MGHMWPYRVECSNLVLKIEPGQMVSRVFQGFPQPLHRRRRRLNFEKRLVFFTLELRCPQ